MGFKNALHFGLVWGRVQDGPRGSKRRPRGPRKPSRVPQEAPRDSQERPWRLQESLKRSQELVQRAQNLPKRCQEPLKMCSKSFPRRPQSLSEAPGPAAVFGKMKKLKAYAHKAFPKHLVRQLFSEKWKNSKHGSKRHRRRLRSPISMNPKGLATTRRMKKGGRAAVIPLGEVNPPPAP